VLKKIELLPDTADDEAEDKPDSQSWKIQLPKLDKESRFLLKVVCVLLQLSALSRGLTENVKQIDSWRATVGHTKTDRECETDRKTDVFRHILKEV